MNPTTENLCRTVAGWLAGKLPCHVSIRRVSCWESEKCGASYYPQREAGAAVAESERRGRRLSMDGEPQEIMCEECGKNRATVHLTDVVEGRPTPHHYCQQCYRAPSRAPARAGRPPSSPRYWRPWRPS